MSKTEVQVATFENYCDANELRLMIMTRLVAQKPWVMVKRPTKNQSEWRVEVMNYWGNPPSDALVFDCLELAEDMTKSQLDEETALRRSAIPGEDYDEEEELIPIDDEWITYYPPEDDED